jgi:hypothetical protein
MVMLRIQQMNPNDLLNEIVIREYNIGQHEQQFAEYHRNLLYFHDKEQNRKRVGNNIWCREGSEGQRHIGHGKGKTGIGGKIKNNAPTGEARREMQSMLEQRAFNLKILNGIYLREQIMEELEEKRAEIVEEWEDEESNLVITENNENVCERYSILSRNSKVSDSVDEEECSLKEKKHENNRNTLMQWGDRVVDLNCQGSALRKRGRSRKVDSNRGKNKCCTQVSIFGLNDSSTDKESVIERAQVEGFFNLGNKIMR